MPDSSLAGTWSIDPSHTRIGFSTRHAMVTRVRGAFNEVSGSVFFDPEQPESSRAELTIQMDSVDTRTPDRRLDRREFGITWNTPLDSGGLLVSDRVQLEFELSFIKDA